MDHRKRLKCHFSVLMIARWHGVDKNVWMKCIGSEGEEMCLFQKFLGIVLKLPKILKFMKNWIFENGKKSTFLYKSHCFKIRNCILYKCFQIFPSKKILKRQKAQYWKNKLKDKFRNLFQSTFNIFNCTGKMSCDVLVTTEVGGVMIIIGKRQLLWRWKYWEWFYRNVVFWL